MSFGLALFVYDNISYVNGYITKFATDVLKWFDSSNWADNITIIDVNSSYDGSFLSKDKHFISNMVEYNNDGYSITDNVLLRRSPRIMSTALNTTATKRNREEQDFVQLKQKKQTLMSSPSKLPIPLSKTLQTIVKSVDLSQSSKAISQSQNRDISSIFNVILSNFLSTNVNTYGLRTIKPINSNVESSFYLLSKYVIQCSGKTNNDTISGKDFLHKVWDFINSTQNTDLKYDKKTIDDHKITARELLTSSDISSIVKLFHINYVPVPTNDTTTTEYTNVNDSSSIKWIQNGLKQTTPKNGNMEIYKLKCGDCWLCKFPVYIYKVVINKGGNKSSYLYQKMGCGEDEHVIPPMLGNILGTLGYSNAVTSLGNPLHSLGVAPAHITCNQVKKQHSFISFPNDESGRFEINESSLNVFADTLVNRIHNDNYYKHDPCKKEVSISFNKKNKGLHNQEVDITIIVKQYLDKILQIVNKIPPKPYIHMIEQIIEVSIQTYINCVDKIIKRELKNSKMSGGGNDDLAPLDINSIIEDQKLLNELIDIGLDGLNECTNAYNECMQIYKQQNNTQKNSEQYIKEQDTITSIMLPDEKENNVLYNSSPKPSSAITPLLSLNTTSRKDNLNEILKISTNSLSSINSVGGKKTRNKNKNKNKKYSLKGKRTNAKYYSKKYILKKNKTLKK